MSEYEDFSEALERGDVKYIDLKERFLQAEHRLAEALKHLEALTSTFPTDGAQGGNRCAYCWGEEDFKPHEQDCPWVVASNFLKAQKDKQDVEGKA